jgi:hypothetical protein
MTTARDHATARSLGVAGLMLVCGWVASGGVLAGARIVLAMRPTPDLQDGLVLLVVSVSMLLWMLWLGSYAVLGLGLAVSVAALVVGGRVRRAGVFLALLTAFGVTHYLLETLRSVAVWDLHADHVLAGVATAGTVAALLAGLVAALVLLGPVVRRPRSTLALAAAG